MKTKLYGLISALILIGGTSYAYKPVGSPVKNPTEVKQASPRGGNCVKSTKQIDMEINNVRARLGVGGEIWRPGRYIVPKVVAGTGAKEVSAIYSGGVWVGGKDPAGALKFMASTYQSATEFDYTPGPLDPTTGETTKEDCLNWDQFFTVKGSNITLLKKRFEEAKVGGRPNLDLSEIPEDVLYWPAKGNKYFASRYNFELPFLPQGLGKFHDNNGNRTYEPELGDYPVIDIRSPKCTDPVYPDEMTFWIYNDAGSIHSQSKGDPIRMEVQVQAFAFQTGDEINDMTFIRYKLINRAPQDIRDCYFAIWTDPDLGCYSDDYIGCNPQKELMFIYNIDASDGSNGCNCDQGVNTYCTDIPALGIDYFRGPLDTTGKELGMSTFMYYNGAGLGGTPPPQTTDPSSGQEFYNYITGRWKDGSPLTKGGTGYGGTEPVKYAFPDDPANSSGWSMCAVNAGQGDRRTIQATGPIVLKPGALNELIVGVVWVPDQDYPCPNLSDLYTADQLSQDLFDNCFKLKDGPDAPNMDFVELDREIVILLSNDKGSNNFKEKLYDYEEKGIGLPPGITDTTYKFEGYRIFQVAGPDVSLTTATINDPSKVREIYKVDLKNGVKESRNWFSIDNPTPSTTHPKIWYPVVMVTGPDQGIKNTFSVVEDQFATGDRALINHKKYYFITQAYGYNNFANYDVATNSGQRTTYCPGRLNLGPAGDGKPYVVTPRPQVYEAVKSKYGDGVAITRYDGVGAGSVFLRLKEGMHDKILDGSFGGKIEYQAGAGPVQIKVVNPLKVKNGDYILKFIDASPNNTKLDLPVTWTITDKANPNDVIASAVDLSVFNEQIIGKLGVSVSIGQTIDAGEEPKITNGIIGSGLEYEYKDVNKPNWFLSQANNAQINFIESGIGTKNFDIDPLGKYANLGEGEFVKGTWYPYIICSGASDKIVTPSFTSTSNTIALNTMRLDSLNNVDIVFTSDKSKWTRCMVIETWNANWGTATSPKSLVGNFIIKPNPSVGKDDNDGDGLADPDGTGTGYGWFPGYAIDVESGKRVNIFFGENSFVSKDQLIGNCLNGNQDIGNDMMWNPNDQAVAFGDSCVTLPLNIIFGGHHYIYVTKQAYDSCKLLKPSFTTGANPLVRSRGIGQITWCTMPLCFPGTRLNPLGNGNTGLIPNDLTVRLRVENKYQWNKGTNDNTGHNLYGFKIDGQQAGSVVTSSEYEEALKDVNVVPNPYYGFSGYENGQFSNIVKITNLPSKCEINIFSIDGKFIKQYKRAEEPQRIVSPYRGITERQVAPALEWDLTNFKGIPVSSGAYLIHIKETTTGKERIIKWFGVARKFDPSGL